MPYSDPSFVLSLPMMPKQYGPDVGCERNEQPVAGGVVGVALGTVVAVGAAVGVLVRVGVALGAVVAVETAVGVLVRVGVALRAAVAVAAAVGVLVADVLDSV